MQKERLSQNLSRPNLKKILLLSHIIHTSFNSLTRPVIEDEIVLVFLFVGQDVVGKIVNNSHYKWANSWEQLPYRITTTTVQGQYRNLRGKSPKPWQSIGFKQEVNSKSMVDINTWICLITLFGVLLLVVLISTVREKFNGFLHCFQSVNQSYQDKKAFLRDQCKEIEENNRMGKTRYLFKKIRDTKGTFHAKMNTIKDRNGMGLTEAENIKNRWQEYTKNYSNKIFMT